MTQPTRRQRPRRIAAFASLAFALALTTCDQPAAGPGGRAALAVQVVIPESPDLALFNLTIDNVRLVVVRPPADTVFNQIFPFPANQTEIPLQADIPMQVSPETFRVTIELLSGTQVLFSGTQDVSLSEGSTNPPAQLPVTYSGPGQNVATLTIGPVDSVLTQGGSLQFRLTAQDAQGATVPTFYASWTTSDPTIAQVDATGLLTAPFSRSTVSVQARTPSNVSVSTPITFIPAPIAINVVSGCGQSGSPGAQLPQPIVARVIAGDGLGVKGILVQFTAPTGGSVATPLVITDDFGLAQTFATLPSQAPAAFSIGATGLASVSCNQTVLGATHLVFSVQPSNIVAGGPITVAVTAMDAFENLVTSFTGAVNLGLAANPGGITFGTPLVAAVGGVATFSGFTITKAASGYSFVASTVSLTPATSAPFDVVPAPPAQLVFTVGPSPSTMAGVPIAPPLQIAIQDAFGNLVTAATNSVTIAIGVNPGGATLGGTLTQTAAVGVATFADLTINRSGSGYTLVASSTGLTDGVSSPFTVTPGEFTLAFTTQPTNVSAGSAITPAVAVAVMDAFGNVLTTFTGGVTIAIGANPSGGALSGNLTVNAVAGVAPFGNLSIDKVGNGYTLVATSPGFPVATSTLFNVTPGAATQLAFTQQPPTSVVAGTGFTVVVTAQDNQGNSATSFAGTVSLAFGSHPIGTVLSGTTTVTAVAGVATFANLTPLTVAGGYTLVTSSSGLQNVVSNSFTVTPAAETALGFLIQPSNVASAAVMTPAVQVAVQDPFGNTVTGATNPITVSLTAPNGATLGGTLTRNAASGVATFTGLTVDKAGTYTLTAVATGLTNGTSASFIVSAGTATQLAVALSPASVTAGTATSVTVTAQDGAGNAATGYRGTVHFTSNDAQATLPPDYTFIAADNGVHTFAGGVTLKTAGSPSVTATDASVGSITGFQTASVTPAAAAALFFTVEPSTTTVGAAITPPVQVTARDAFGNTAISFSAPVTVGFGNNPVGATLGGNTTVSAAAGIASFAGLTVDQPGIGFTLTAAATGPTGATSTPFDVTAVGAVMNAWTNGAGGAWSVPGNWSQGRVPATTDSVVIALAGTYTVTLDTTISVAFLTFGASSGTQTLAMSTRTLTVTSAATIQNGSVATVNNGTIAGSAAVTNHGTLTLGSTTVNSAFTNQGLLVVHGANTVNGALTTVAGAGSVVRVEGINANGTGALTVLNGFTNTAGIELTNANVNQAATLVVTNGTLTNAAGGTISALVGATGGARTLTAQLDNQGTLTVSQALTLNRGSAAHTNSGTITLSGGNLTFTQSGTTPSFTNTGSVAIGAGLFWLISGGTLNQNAGSISGPGTLDLTSLTANFPAGFSNATLGLNINSVTVNGPGTLTNATSRTLTLQNSTINAPLTNQGLLLIHGANTVNGALTTVAGAGSVVRVEGINANGTGALTVLNGFTNTAGIELTNANVNQAATLVVTNGTLTNAAGGTISALVGATGGARTLTAQLDNQGTLTVSQALTLNRGSAAHTNSGTITLSGGNLTFTQSGTTPSFTNTGSVAIGAGLFWLISGGTLNQNAGSISGPGTLDLTSLTANFPAGFSNATLGLNINSVTVNGPGTLTNATSRTLTLQNSTINAPLTNQGLLLIHGANTVNGALTTVAGAGSVVRVEGINANGTGALTVLNGFTNTAGIELTNANVNQAATLVVTNGTLTNAAGGTISALVGATGGARTLTAQLDNQGTLTVSQALTLNRGSAAHTNSGTITLSGGNLTFTQSGTTPSFTNTGSVAIGAGLFWLISGGTLNQNAGSISGPGTLDLTSLTANFPAGFSNATLGLNINSVTVNGPGTLTNATSRTLTLQNSTINAPLTNQGLLLIHGANTVNGALTTVAGAGSVVRVEGINANGTGALTVLNGFTNTAGIELTNANVNQAATLVVTNGTLTNAAGGTISALVGATGGARTLTAQLDNQGTLTVSQALTLNRGSAAHTNSGTITLSGGNLTFTQSGTTPSFTNTGSVAIGAGLFWLISGGTLNQNAGSISGPGTLDLTSLTANFPAGFSNATLGLNINSVTVNGPGTLTNATSRTLTLQNSTINAPLTNQGLLLIHGANTVNGALTTVAGAGSVVRVEGINANGTGALTVLNGFTNTAGIELTNANVNQAATLVVTNGTLTNAAGGTISALVGATGGARTLTAQLDNQGTLTVSQALTLNRGSAAHTNSGTITLSGGDLTVILSGFRPDLANTSTGVIDVGTNKLVINNQSSGSFTNAGGGVLRGSGTIDIGTSSFITNGRTIVDGSPGGRLNWVGPFLMGPNQTFPSVLELDVAGLGANPGTDYDQLNVSDNVTLQGGTLLVTGTLVPGETYFIIEVPAGKTITGDFQNKTGLGQCASGVSGTVYVIVCP